MSNNQRISPADMIKFAETHRMCICIEALPLLPVHGSQRIQPSPYCPLHKTLAKRWNQIKTWADFNDALNADKLPGEPLSTLPN